MKKSMFWVGGIVIAGVIVALILIFALRKPSYEVSFISDGKEVMDALTVKEDGTLEEPEEPKKEGYKFIGWFSNSEKFDFSTKITEDITLEAKWAENTKKLYTLSFDTKGGNKIASFEVEENMTVANLPIPKKDGYEFLGWFSGSDEVTSTTKITKDMTLVAKWEKVTTTTTKKKSTKKTTTKATTTTTTTSTTTKTTTTTTTKATTTTAKVVLDFDIVELEYGQVMLYIVTSDGKRVDGIADITTLSSTVKDFKIPASGFKAHKNEIVSVKNIRLD